MMNKCKLINLIDPEDCAGNCYEATHWCHFFCWWNKHSYLTHPYSCIRSPAYRPCTKTIYSSEKKKRRKIVTIKILGIKFIRQTINVMNARYGTCIK